MLFNSINEGKEIASKNLQEDGGTNIENKKKQSINLDDSFNGRDQHVSNQN